MSKQDKFVVMDPTGYPPRISPLRMAPRLDSLDGKTVYIMDTRFDDSDILLSEMDAWFKANMPQVNSVFVRKAGVYTQDDPALYAEIAAKADAVVVGVGH